ncbi:MAG TPA: flagellar biosynthesis protein FlhF [Syntrophomonadaceae bacterium]|nr:flagellar biosynthesis protein FlhF [Syntrophomonadaceae bacterium]
MRIKKFIAKDYKIAIKQAKAEMGNDAIILHTRQIKTDGILGFFAKNKVEVTVAVDDTLQVNMDKLRKSSFKTINIPDENEPENTNIALMDELNNLKIMMSDIKTRMYEIELIKGMSEEIREFYHILVKNNVDKDLALDIVSSVEKKLPKDKENGESWTREVLLHTLQQYIKEIKPIEIKNDKKAKVIFFVGPTGVGKTTTIAKLAANITFIDKKNVALITLDTYRISAAEQLRTFAEIIGIPMSVVFETYELEELIDEYNDKDIVLVDTAGRSPYNDEHMNEIKEFVDVAHPDEIILVLSAITESSDLINIYNRFSLIRIDKVVFTKLDETNNYGQILNAIYEIKKPIAYLTNGQNVPDDIEIPDSLYLAKMFLGKDKEL